MLQERMGSSDMLQERLKSSQIFQSVTTTTKTVQEHRTILHQQVICYFYHFSYTILHIHSENEFYTTGFIFHVVPYLSLYENL